MVQSIPKAITLEEFLAQPEIKPAREFIAGAITQKPMPQGQHSRVRQKMTTTINAKTEDARIALALPELRCTFGNRSIVPDVAVFTWERLHTNDDGTIAKHFMISPDWTIEILSPGQSGTRVISNILHCLDHGATMGWLLDPNEKLIFSYGPNQQPQFFEQDDDRLPVPLFVADLQLTVAQVWDWLTV